MLGTLNLGENMEQGDEKRPFEEPDNGLIRTPGNPYVPLEARTEPIPVYGEGIEASIEEAALISDDEPKKEYLYYRERHVTFFLARLWYPWWYLIGTISLAIVVLPFVLPGIPVMVSILGLLIAIIAIGYPLSREFYRWKNTVIAVYIEDDTIPRIARYEPKNTFFGFNGSKKGISFLLTPNVAVDLGHQTWLEQIVFKKSGYGSVETMLQEDKELKGLRSVYRPDLLERAIKQAVRRTNRR